MTEVVGPRRFQRFGIHFGQFQAFGTFQSEVGSLKSEVQRLGTPLDRSPRSTGVVSKDSKPLELASTRNEARTRRLNGLEPHWTGLCAARARVSKDSKPLDLVSTRNEAQTRRLNGLEPHRIGLCAARAWVSKDSKPLDLVSTRNEARARRLHGLEPHRTGLCAARAWVSKDSKPLEPHRPSLWATRERVPKFQALGTSRSESGTL